MEQEKLSEKFTVATCIYLGNSKNAINDELWKNWEMLIQVQKQPAKSDKTKASKGKQKTTSSKKPKTRSAASPKKPVQPKKKRTTKSKVGDAEAAGAAAKSKVGDAEAAAATAKSK